MATVVRNAIFGIALPLASSNSLGVRRLFVGLYRKTGITGSWSR